MTWDRNLNDEIIKSPLFLKAWDIVEKIDDRYRKYSTKVEKLNDKTFNFDGKEYRFDAYKNYAGWVNVSLIYPGGQTVEAFEL